MEFHALAPQDWEVLRAQRRRALLDAPEAFVSDHQREAAYDAAAWRRFATDCQWFVATDGLETVGMAGGLPATASVVPVREVIGMWVAPDRRRQGTARALPDHLADWARSLGAETLLLGLDTRNSAARAAYLRAGMRLTGETEPVDGDPTRTIELMERDLRTL